MWRCGVCGVSLHEARDGTLVHPGGSAYVMYCKSCRTRSDVQGLTACPQCGKGRPIWRDDHRVVPVKVV